MKRKQQKKLERTQPEKKDDRRKLRKTKNGNGLQKENVRHLTGSRAINSEHEKLIHWFQTVKFRKVMVGGVDEAQLWKKLEELNKLYEAAINAERIRYDALLDAQKKNFKIQIDKYKQEDSERTVQSGAERREQK